MKLVISPLPRGIQKIIVRQFFADDGKSLILSVKSFSQIYDPENPPAQVSQ